MQSEVMIHLYCCDRIIRTCQNALKLLNVSLLFLDPIEILLILKNIQCSVFTSPFWDDVLLSQLICYSCHHRHGMRQTCHLSLCSASPGRMPFNCNSFITGESFYWEALKLSKHWFDCSSEWCMVNQGCLCSSQLRDRMCFKMPSVRD